MNPNVDFTETTSCLEWCAGYGGISLGLKRAISSLRTIAFGEIEAFACANLVAKMEAGLLDPAPIWTDLKTFPCEQFRDRVDILVAGYPCQPFSAAGKRLGTEDPRHLWPFIQRSISIIRPRLCFFENVEGHISLGLREVIGDLGAAGYKAAWGIFSASEVGAPHQRKRVFILAYRNESGWQARWHNAISSQGRQPHELVACGGDQGGAEELAVSNSLGGAARLSRSLARDEGIAGVADNSGGQVWPSRPGEPQHEWEPPRVVGAEAMGNAESWRRGESGDKTCKGQGHWPSRSGRGDDEQCKTEQSMGLHSDGTSDGLGHAELPGLCDSELAEIREWMVKTDNRTDELRLLGNGVVPATAERAFRVLMDELLTADTQ